MGRQFAAAALRAEDTDGQIRRVGHGDVVESVADGDDAAGQGFNMVCLDGALDLLLKPDRLRATLRT